MNTVIEIENLTKIYETKKVLNISSLSFAEGKVTGLLGPNGAGKSTLMKIMVGLVKPNSGSIKVFGENPSRQLNSQIAYLPDRAGWYQFQKVKESIDYAEKIYSDFDKNKAINMMKQMKLDPEMKVGSLSRGQQACLYLIFCLARRASLCILDEPFSGIDLISRERIIQGIIDSIMGKNQTIIISTHEIYEAESLFENAVFLDCGNVCMTAEVEELRSKGESLESEYRRLFK